MTICTKDKNALYGEIVSAKVRLNKLGNIVARCWLALPRHFPNVLLDVWVLMPNHLHGILILCESEGRGDASAASILRKDSSRVADASPLQRPHGTDRGSLGAIVQNFKSISSRRINSERGTPGSTVWQRNYYEHIIRNEHSLNFIRDYILNNPAQWESDSENPDVVLRRHERCIRD